MIRLNLCLHPCLEARDGSKQAAEIVNSGWGHTAIVAIAPTVLEAGQSLPCGEWQRGSRERLGLLTP